MGLFKKKSKREEENNEYKWMTVGEAFEHSQYDSDLKAMKKSRRKWQKKNKQRKTDLADGTAMTGDVLRELLEDTCRQYVMMERQQLSFKEEYAEVSEYLSDIQKLDDLSAKDKRTIGEAANTILSISRERDGYQKKNRRVSGEKSKRLELYEENVEDDIKRMEENEKYLMLVKNDLRQLEGEKGSIQYEREQALYKRSFLKKFSYIVCLTFMSVFIVLFMMSRSLGKDFTVPFFVSGVTALLYTAYFVVQMRNTAVTVKKDDSEMRRAVTLINKVKIKYVNTTNLLDYTYEKYGVNSYRELAFLWEAFKLDKEDEERYKKNTNRLNSSYSMLTAELEKLQLSHSDVWVHQTSALINKKEMVEVRHSLNERRQKLRNSIESSAKHQESIRSELIALKESHAGEEAVITELLKKYGIELY